MSDEPVIQSRCADLSQEAEIERLRDLIREAIDAIPPYLDGGNDDLIDRMARAIGEFVEDDEDDEGATPAEPPQSGR